MIVRLFCLTWLLCLTSAAVDVNFQLMRLFPKHASTPELQLAHFDFVLSAAELFNSKCLKFTKGQVISSHQRILGRLHDVLHPDHGKMHRFLLRFRDQCGADCHVPMVDSYGHVAYRIVDHRTALLSATLAEAEALHANTQSILDFTPLLPEVKIAAKVLHTCFDYHDAKLSLFNQSQTDSLSAGVGFGVADMPATTITVVTTDLPSDEIIALVEKIYALTKGGLVRDNPYNAPIYNAVDNFLTFRFDPESDPRCTTLESNLDAISELREVQWIEQRFKNYPSNRWVKGITQVADSKYTPLTLRPTAALTGAGQIIGVSDTGIDMSSCYFYDPDTKPPYTKTGASTSAHRKLVQYYTFVDASDDDESHGTHVSGTILGKAYSAKAYGDFVKYNGMVTEAKIAFFDIGKTCYGTETKDCGLNTPQDINNGMFAIQYAAGARIMSESWGCSSVTSKSCGGYYDSQASQVDRFMWFHQDAVVFIANGNTGSTAGGAPSSVGSPATAKSSVSVGASLTETNVFKAFANSVPDGVTSDFDINGLAYFSSRGPTLDGRIKPEVTAPGWWITSAAGKKNSTTNHCTLRTLQGTSMATPATAGNAAIIRQYFMDGFYPSGSRSTSDSFIPQGALIKAMLMHSAQPLTHAVEVSQSTGKTAVKQFTGLSLPDNNQGYGRVQLDKVLYFGAGSDLCADLLNCPDADSSANNSHNYPPRVLIKPLTFFIWGGVEGKHQSNVTKQGGQYFYFQAPSSVTGNTLLVSMAYTDYPSASQTDGNLVNKVDVQVEGPITIDEQQADKSCIDPCKIYKSGLLPVANSHARVTIKSGLAAGNIYRIYVGPQISNYPQPFALVASFSASETGATLKPYIDADKPITAYSMPGRPASYISSTATTIIAVFSVVGAILSGLVGVIYFSHKQVRKNEKPGAL